MLRNSLESEKLLRKKYYNNNEIYIENVFKKNAITAGCNNICRVPRFKFSSVF